MDKIVDYLNQATQVEVSGTLSASGRNIEYSENCIINVDRLYSEASGVLYKNSSTTNCIRWVQEITGIPLNCGIMTQQPKNCAAVSPELWNEFKYAYNHGKPDDLQDIITRIQTHLSPGCCTSTIQSGVKMVRNCLPCGGSKKRKTRKFAKKRVRKNKTKRKKGSI